MAATLCRTAGGCRPAVRAPPAARTTLPAPPRATPNPTPPPDVSRVVVGNRLIRAPPLPEAEARADLQQHADDAVVLAFVSESAICRAPLAAAAARRALAALNPPLSAPAVLVEALAARDYCLDEGPDPDAVAAAQDAGLADDAFLSGTATLFNPPLHGPRADVVLAMDRFVAEDVLRELTIFDTVSAGGGGSGGGSGGGGALSLGSKVRMLGGFAARGGGGGGKESSASATLSLASDGTEAWDVDDPLYGNPGGPAQAAAVRDAAGAVVAGVDGLVAWLAALDAEARASGTPLRAALRAALGEAGEIAWLAPPMLAPRG
jgi:protein-tyrosine-phosphatase